MILQVQSISEVEADKQAYRICFLTNRKIVSMKNREGPESLLCLPS